jgi:hypothetical protein
MLYNIFTLPAVQGRRQSSCKKKIQQHIAGQGTQFHIQHSREMENSLNILQDMEHSLNILQDTENSLNILQDTKNGLNIL